MAPSQLRALSMFIEGSPITGQPDEVQGHLRALTSDGWLLKTGGEGGDAFYYRTPEGRDLLVSEHVCQVCHRPEKNASPFKLDDGRKFARVCGGCKVRLALSPERKATLEHELSIMVAEMTGQPTAIELTLKSEGK
jgi:hypothetical protein